jgi:microcystin-dependent protein
MYRPIGGIHHIRRIQRDNYEQIYNCETFNPSLMIGEIKAYGAVTAPQNHLVCDGAAISRAQYPELFAVIGTDFGAGDGSTTFNLPNLKGRILVGFNTGDTDFNTVGKVGGADTINTQHTHTQTDHTHNISCYTNYSGSHQGSGSGKTVSSWQHRHTIGVVATGGASNLGMDTQGSATQTVMNAYLTMQFIIQYRTKRANPFIFASFLH